jgi:chromatin structure-remodeling complex subunit SFH1
MSGLSKLPQALQTGFASRLRLEQTSLFISTQPIARAAKRVSTAINYAEIEEDFDDEEDDPSYGGGSGGSTGPGSVIGGPISSYEKQLERKVEIKKPAAKTKHVQYSPQQLGEIADSEEILVPLRVNLEYDNYRITDFFMWNLKEQVLTPEAFAIVTCNDLELPVGFTSNIANSIKTQLAEFAAVADVRLPTDCGIHVIMHLSVNLDKQLYEDKFEWDLGSDLTPEEFAKCVVKDLGLSGEFYPAIAHAVYDTLLKMKREAVEGHLPQEVDNLAAFNKEAGLRVDQEFLGEEWAPTVEVLSQEEIEKREIERERNIRRLKRESVRMGADVTDIGGLFARGKRRRRDYDRDSPSQANSPSYW